MSKLKDNLTQILQEKQEKIIPENIRKDVQVFNVIGTLDASGTDTSDATATVNDIINPKTAYVNGKKITGKIMPVMGDFIFEPSETKITFDEGLINNNTTLFQDINMDKGIGIRLNKSGQIELHFLKNNAFTDADKKVISYEELGISQFNTGTCKFISEMDDTHLSILICYAKIARTFNYNASLFTLDLTNYTLEKTSDLSNILTVPNRRTEYADTGWKFMQERIETYQDKIILGFTMAPGVGFVATDWKFYYTMLSVQPESNLIQSIKSGNIQLGGVARGDDWNHSYPMPVSSYISGNYFVLSEYIKDRGDGKNYYVTVFLNLNTYQITFKMSNSSNQGYILYKDMIYGNNGKYSVTNPDTKLETVDFSFPGNNNSFVVDTYIFVVKDSNIIQYKADTLSTISTTSGYTSVIWDSINFKMLFLGNKVCLPLNSTSVIKSFNRNGIDYFDTADSTAIAEDLLAGKTAYGQTGKIQGTMPNNGELNYTPTTAEQAIPAGYTSGGTVAGDSNLIPENIKKDISIFNVTGTLETGIDTSSDNPITADDVIQGKEGFVNGEKIIGSLYKYPDTFTVTANHERTSVKLDQDPVMQTPSINISIQESSFIDTVAMDKWKGEDIYVSYDNLVSTIGLTPEKIVEGNTILNVTGTATTGDDVSNYINLNPTGTSLRFTSLITKVPEIDTSSITNMSNAFSSYLGLKEISLLNTSNVTNMYRMFYQCNNLTTIPQIDTSKVTNMESMFDGCSNLTTIPEINTSKVTNMESMFDNCSKLTTIPQIDTSKTKTTERMFFSCRKLTTIPQLDMSNNITMNQMFNYCESLVSISLINTSNVTNMSNAFSDCSSLTTIIGLDTSNATNIYGLFSNCSSLTTIPEINTSSATTTGYMFHGCKSLTTTPLLNTSKVTDMSYMFSDCSNLTIIPLLDTSQVTDMRGMFDGCSKLETVPMINTSSVTNMYQMFRNCTNLTTIPEINTSNVTNMDYMFNFCNNLTTIPQLNMNNVSSMSSMFNDCVNLSNDSLNNILASLLTATSYTGTKTLNRIGLSSTQATTCTTLSNWSACESAGWTTGY